MKSSSRWGYRSPPSGNSSSSIAIKMKSDKLMAKAEGKDYSLEIGGRLSAGPSQLLINSAFSEELNRQLHLMNELGIVDLSHTLSAMELGVIPTDPGRELLRVLRDLKNEPEDFIPDPAYGDLYTNREAWIVERTQAAVWLGAGRARREAITTAFFIKLREQLLHLANALLPLLETLLSRSQLYASTVMPDYTYLQSAQPTTFGHFLLSPAYGIIRDIERLQIAYKHVNRSPAGCGSTVGSRIPQNRLRLAELMGFEGVVTHCRDAMWPADIPIEVNALATNILINMNRLAEDLIVFNSQEFRLIELHDRHCRASKIMPHKKNPFALTYIRGLTNEVIGNLTSTAAMARTPSGQPDNRLAIYGILPDALAKTINAVKLFAEVIVDLNFNEKRGLELANDSLICATDLAETLVMDCGMEFRNAHRLVASLIREHGGDGKRFQALHVNDINEMAELLGFHIPTLSEQALQQALEPELSILCKRDIGGCSPDALSTMADSCRQRMKSFEVWASDKKKRFEKSQADLEKIIDQALKE